jgi:hypothetical protein
MNHFDLHLSNDPVAGAAGRAIINAKLKGRLFRFDVRQYQGFSAPGTGRSQLVRFCVLSPDRIEEPHPKGNSAGGSENIKNNKCPKKRRRGSIIPVL